MTFQQTIDELTKKYSVYTHKFEYVITEDLIVLSCIAIKSRYQRQGIFKSIIKELVDICKLHEYSLEFDLPTTSRFPYYKSLQFFGNLGLFMGLKNKTIYYKLFV